MEKSTKIFIICELIGILLLAFSIAYPSYTSYLKGTNSTKFKESIEQGKLAGFYDPNNDIIILYKNSTWVLRHELVHKEQFMRENYTYTFWSEVEANIRELFFWEKVNLTSKSWER